MFPWLRDIRLSPAGITFVLFRAWAVCTVPPAQVESVRRYGHVSFSAWDLFDFRCRYIDPSYVLTLRSGWFARKIAISPPSSAEFMAWVKTHGIPYLETPYP